MAFLTVYGIAVSVADREARAVDKSLRTLGRSANGAAFGSQAAELMGLDCRTTPQAPDVAGTLRALLRSRGDRWGFDFTNAGEVDGYPQFSAKGLGPKASPTPSYRTRGEYGTDYIAQSTSSIQTVPKRGDGCLEMVGATTNLFAAHVQNGSDTGPGTLTDFAAVGGAAASPVSSTATAWQGSRSVLMVCAGTGEGLRANKGSGLSGSTTYTGSVYLKRKAGSVDQEVTVYLKETAGGTATGASKTVHLSLSVWRRVEVSITTGVGVSGVGLIIEQSGGNIDFYADGFQLEERAFATGWTDTVRSACELQYALGEVGKTDDVTVMAWLRMPLGSLGASWAWALGSPTEAIYVGQDTGALVYGYTNADDGANTDSVAGVFSGANVGVWRHVALVMQRNPVSGRYALEVFVDGVLADTFSVSSRCPTLSLPTLYVGNDANGGGVWNGLIDELVVIPAALNATAIAALSARELTYWPDLMVGGSALGSTAEEDERRMVGNVTGDSYVQAVSGTAHTPLMRVLEFTLDPAEVE